MLINSPFPKKEELKSFILTENPDIITICEAKPKNGALREIFEYKITGFNTICM